MKIIVCCTDCHTIEKVHIPLDSEALCGRVWQGMVWYGRVGYGMVGYGMVEYGRVGQGGIGCVKGGGG